MGQNRTVKSSRVAKTRIADSVGGKEKNVAALGRVAAKETRNGAAQSACQEVQKLHMRR